MPNHEVQIGFVGPECFGDDGSDLYGSAPMAPSRRLRYGSYALLDGTPAFADGESLFDVEAMMIEVAEARMDEDAEERAREQLLTIAEDDEVERRDGLIAHICYLAELDENAAPPDEFARAIAWIRERLERLDTTASRTSSHRAVVEEFDGWDLFWPSKPPAHRPYKERTPGRTRRRRRLAVHVAA